MEGLMGKELKVVEHSLCAVSGSSRDDAGFRSHSLTKNVISLRLYHELFYKS